MNRILFLFIVVLMLCSCTRFDAEIWKTDKDERAAMYEQMGKQHMLIGMSEAEIIELLGYPEVIADDGSYQYYVGPSGLMGIKVNVLVINFDESGYVSEHGIDAK